MPEADWDRPLRAARSHLPRGYWRGAAETVGREELRRWQWHKLQVALRHAYVGSPFWRGRMDESGCPPDSIRSLSEYTTRFPLLNRDEIIRAEERDPPYGDFAACDPRLAIRHHQTSGTSGNPPLRVFDTGRDWAWGADCWATGLYGMGVRQGDVVMVAFGYAMFIGFWGLHYALELIGARVIATGSLDSETRLRFAAELGVNVFAATPSYALRFAAIATRAGVHLSRMAHMKLVITSGEPRPPATTRQIEEAFSAPCLDSAGMSEAGSIFMFECPDNPGGSHIIEPDFIEEVLHPETREPVDYGEMGVRVMTALGREGFHTFRYWTNDLVVKQRAEACGCGRTWDWYEGGIRGRTDDMVKIRGVWFMPVMLEEVVRRFKEVEEYQATVDSVDSLDTLIVDVEPKVEVPSGDHSALLDRIRTEVKRQLSLTPLVRLAGRDSLPRFETKAKRFRDSRGSHSK